MPDRDALQPPASPESRMLHPRSDRQPRIDTCAIPRHALSKEKIPPSNRNSHPGSPCRLRLFPYAAASGGCLRCRKHRFAPRCPAVQTERGIKSPMVQIDRAPIRASASTRTVSSGDRFGLLSNHFGAIISAPGAARTALASTRFDADDNLLCGIDCHRANGMSSQPNVRSKTRYPCVRPAALVLPSIHALCVKNACGSFAHSSGEHGLRHGIDERVRRIGTSVDRAIAPGRSVITSTRWPEHAFRNGMGNQQHGLPARLNPHQLDVHRSRVGRRARRTARPSA